MKKASLHQQGVIILQIQQVQNIARKNKTVFMSLTSKKCAAKVLQCKAFCKMSSQKRAEKGSHLASFG